MMTAAWIWGSETSLQTCFIRWYCCPDVVLMASGRLRCWCDVRFSESRKSATFVELRLDVKNSSQELVPGYHLHGDCVVEFFFPSPSTITRGQRELDIYRQAFESLKRWLEWVTSTLIAAREEVIQGLAQCETSPSCDLTALSAGLRPVTYIIRCERQGQGEVKQFTISASQYNPDFHFQRVQICRSLQLLDRRRLYAVCLLFAVSWCKLSAETFYVSGICIS